MENGVKTVVVLAGGYSSEHEISLASGQTAYAAFESAGYRTLFVIVDRSGYSLEGKSVRLEDLGADYVFNSIHGSPGEDGHISGVLELLNLPHSTCPTFQSALTFNKAQCNAVLRDAGIRVPKGQLFNAFPRLYIFYIFTLLQKVIFLSTPHLNMIKIISRKLKCYNFIY